MTESYRNNQELFNLQCWALTCETFFSLRNGCGYLKRVVIKEIMSLFISILKFLYYKFVKLIYVKHINPKREKLLKIFLKNGYIIFDIEDKKKLNLIKKILAVK